MTRFHTISPQLSRMLLIFLAALIVYGWAIPFRGINDPQPELAPGDGDVALYTAIVERVRGGENYYAVVGNELFTRGYPVRPFLTWRLPTAAWLIAAFPNNTFAVVLMRILAIAVALAWMWRIRSFAGAWPKVAAGALLFMSGLIGCVAPNGIFFQETWAMLLMSGALALHNQRSWGWSVALGTLAMLFRELALPLACAMFACALFERRRAEAMAWAAGIAIFGVALALHASAVQAVPVPAVARSSQGWLVLGGWSFILSASQWNVLAALLPKAAMPVMIPLALLGLAAWKGGLGTRVALTVAMYVGAFLLIGRPDNDYWGLIYAPFVPLGLFFAPAALRDLWRAAARRQPQVNPASQQT